MDNFHIETAQNVTIQQNVAPISTRIGAFLLDLLIMIGYYLLVYLILNALDYFPDESQYAFYILLSLPVFFYNLLFETLMNGQSPGKYFTKIRVTKLDGSKPTFGSFLIRWVLRLVDITISTGSLALLTLFLSGKGQRLGDLAAGTTVITEKKTISINDTIIVDIPDNYQPTFPQVTMLTDKDVQIIKDLFSNARRRGNHKTILKLHTKIIDITGIKTEMKPVEFVQTIVADYNYFTQQM